MTLSELHTMLNGIMGFDGKVAYRAFKKGHAPALPFICYLETQTSNFTADNKVYKVIQEVDIELYSELKDMVSEGLIEDCLNRNEIVWEKYEEYISSENMYQITYTINIDK